IRERARHPPMLVGRPGYAGMPLLTFVTLMMFLGATGKSAQIPLFAWLPDGMAGPTPVSALIHAATMVTAGIYMVARLNFLFSMAPATMTVVAGVGGVARLRGGPTRGARKNIKKVPPGVALSTLGYTVAAGGGGWACTRAVCST